jgi:RNA polymerase sigma factor (sigma-70 family)
LAFSESLNAGSGASTPRHESSEELQPIAGSVTMLYRQLSAGDPAAAGQLWRRFFPRIASLAQKTLSGRPQRMADADDAAQSAFVAFWRQAERGDFGAQLDRGNLWALLATITVRKALKQVSQERAQKRGGGKVVGEDQLDAMDTGRPLEQLMGSLPAQEMDLYCQELLLELDEELRQIALLRLMGYSTREIAQQLGCTQRKIQRKLELLQLRWASS